MRRGEPLAPEALEPIRQGMHRQFGPFSAGIATGVQVRHDHGVSIGTMISSRNSAFWESCRASIRARPGRQWCRGAVHSNTQGAAPVGANVPDRRRPSSRPSRLALSNEQWLIERHGFRAPPQVRRALLAAEVAA